MAAFVVRSSSVQLTNSARDTTDAMVDKIRKLFHVKITKYLSGVHYVNVGAYVGVEYSKFCLCV